MPNLSTQFALLEEEQTCYETASSVIFPVPFERTTSYGKGTARGPQAIIEASYFLELYDEELRCEPCDQGIATLPPFLPDAFELRDALAEIEEEALRHMRAGKFVVTLGGEHSLTYAPVKAAQQHFGSIGIVQFDAHADLRDSFEGTAQSHACVMRRISELGIPSAAVGLRAISAPEAEWIEAHNMPVIWGYQLDEAEQRLDALLDTLPDQVYLTFDIDFFDPSLVPATGTPEPGGGFWTPTLQLLRRLFEKKTVVAMDVVELAPIGGFHAYDFLTAKLVYKCLGYRMASELETGQPSLPPTY